MRPVSRPTRSRGLPSTISFVARSREPIWLALVGGFAGVGGVLLGVSAAFGAVTSGYSMWTSVPAIVAYAMFGLAVACLASAVYEVPIPLPGRRSSAGPSTRSGSSSADPSAPVMTWEHGVEQVGHFVGRAEELARLDRWAADPKIHLIGVSAWGGAGKTALVAHWIEQGGPASRPEVQGVFGWTFNTDPSTENWSAALFEWAEREFGLAASTAHSAASILDLLRSVPLLLVLDGLEIIQQGPVGVAVPGNPGNERYGRLLDGLLRDVLSGACQLDHCSLVVLTSRFPFADLEMFDGDAAQMMEVPAFTPAEGSRLLSAAGGHWLAEDERQKLVAAVEGHALAVSVLAAALTAHPPASDLATLRGELAEVVQNDRRLGHVLQFYSGRLTDQDRYLVAAVSLFGRPVPPERRPCRVEA